MSHHFDVDLKPKRNSFMLCLEAFSKSKASELVAPAFRFVFRPVRREKKAVNTATKMSLGWPGEKLNRQPIDFGMATLTTTPT